MRLKDLDGRTWCCVCGHVTHRGSVSESGDVTGFGDFDWRWWVIGTEQTRSNRRRRTG